MALPQHNNGNVSRSRQPPQPQRTVGRRTAKILMVTTFLLGFFIAILLTTPSTAELKLRDLQQHQQADVDRLVRQALTGDNLDKLCAQHAGRALEDHLEHETAHQQQAQLFPSETMGRFAVALASVSKEEFTEHYDLGVPLDRSSAGSEDMLVLYSNSKALPSNFGEEDFNRVGHRDAREAVENCEYLNIVLTDHGNRNQCIAIMPQYESYHLQKWMRISPSTGQLDDKADLQMVSRGQQHNGRDQFEPPDLVKDTRKHWLMLERYFANLDAVLEELKPILQKIALDNTVIVMVRRIFEDFFVVLLLVLGESERSRNYLAGRGFFLTKEFLFFLLFHACCIGHRIGSILFARSAILDNRNCS